MSTTPEPNELVSATDRLSDQVRRLGDKIKLSEEALRRQKTWIRATWSLMLLVLVVVVWVWVVAGDAQDASKAATANAKDNKANAVKNCQNANESRRGAKLLWTSIIDAPRADGDERTPEQLAQLAELKRFITELYQDRDCADLNREYPLPDPPRLGVR